jgi:uncharacterized protein (DUF2461 family)
MINHLKKSNFGAHITGTSDKSDLHLQSGYYLHIEPGKSFLSGGAYQPTGTWIKAVRQEIAQNADELKKILNSKSIKNTFGEMEGEKLKPHLGTIRPIIHKLNSSDTKVFGNPSID